VTTLKASYLRPFWKKPVRMLSGAFQPVMKEESGIGFNVDPTLAQQLWKDAGKGRVLLCFDDGGEKFKGVVSVAMARVPKMLPCPPKDG
jgi:hypothetical protein